MTAEVAAPIVNEAMTTYLSEVSSFDSCPEQATLPWAGAGETWEWRTWRHARPLRSLCVQRQPFQPRLQIWCRTPGIRKNGESSSMERERGYPEMEGEALSADHQEYHN
jgi:hypothetical protein